MLNNNFSINKNSDIPKIIAPIERAFKFSTLQKDSIRHPIKNNVDFNTKLSHSNLNNSAKNSFKTLKSNRDLIITKANKRCQIVVLNKAKYIKNVMSILTSILKNI